MLKSYFPILAGFVLMLTGLPGFHSVQAQRKADKTQVQASISYPANLLEANKYRAIGPFRGGRVTAVTGIPAQTFTFFMGTTGGGVWKTTDAGQTWDNISDGFFAAGSIGAVEVALSDPNVMYVGTGSASPRGNISAGVGMYKSTDGGATWSAIGLEKSGQIGKIQIHPGNPDLVYVAALGNVFGKNSERGVFRSKDGGSSWEKVLYLNDSTGAIDMVMDYNNPRVIYAGFWRAERKPWTMIDGGQEGGLYKTTDGGDTWQRLEGGLPDGIVGRIGVAVSPANSQRLWVIQEAKEEHKGGVFRSDDAGKTWTKVNREHKLRQRAWYYSRIFADPQDENTVYVLNTNFYKSVDGGKTFTNIPVPHGDNHCLWINPMQPNIMVQSNDGGANVSLNGGKSWSTQLNQPTAEFYRVTVDNQFPYRVYGAQQDNTTISVPSRPPGGITPKQHWYAVGGGESGHIAVDPRNPDIIYAGNYIGQIDRVNRATGHSRNIVAYPQMHDGVAPKDIKYRFQWNAPIRLSPHNPDVLYHTSQYVHRSSDGGQSWETISPDLSTNNPAYQELPGGPIQHDHTGVELYTTIFAFEESPLVQGQLWAGTDDGRIHLSTDNGSSWQEITPSNLPKEATINTIELSVHNPERAFVAAYKYRENDFKPYIFRTNDLGKTWQLLSNNNGIPQNHFVRVVREDPKNKGLLFAGTEFGMYASFDDGVSWQSLQLNLPVTPITDMLIKDNDLVVATQGRSFWILDDISAIRQLTPDIATKPAHLFTPSVAYRTQLRAYNSPGEPEAAPYGALIYFSLSASAAKDTVIISILDENQQEIKVFSTSADKEKGESELEVQEGLNRLNWNLTGQAPVITPNSYFSLSYTGGPFLPPGVYTVKMHAGNQTTTQLLTVEKDPRWEASDEDLVEQYALAMKTLGKLNEAHVAIRQLRSAREQALEIAKKAVKAGFGQEIESAADDLAEKLTAIEEELIQYRNESGQDPINYPPKLDDQIAYLYSTINFQDAKPNKGAYERYEDLEAELNKMLSSLSEIMETDLQDFHRLLEAQQVPAIILDGK